MVLDLDERVPCRVPRFAIHPARFAMHSARLPLYDVVVRSTRRARARFGTESDGTPELDAAVRPPTRPRPPPPPPPFPKSGHLVRGVERAVTVLTAPEPLSRARPLRSTAHSSIPQHRRSLSQPRAAACHEPRDPLPRARMQAGSGMPATGRPRSRRPRPPATPSRLRSLTPPSLLELSFPRQPPPPLPLPRTGEGRGVG